MLIDFTSSRMDCVLVRTTGNSDMDAHLAVLRQHFEMNSLLQSLELMWIFGQQMLNLNRKKTPW